MQRESFKSRLGFILVSAGCAIGIGNVWRFPYVTGQNGGGIFVLLYLTFLIVMALPVLTMELSVGRASRLSSIEAFKKLEKPGQKWHLHGYASLLGNYVLMMFYTVVSGWMFTYFYKFITGEFKAGMTSNECTAVFDELLSNPLEMTLWMAVVVILGFFVCSKGLQNGIEKITKIMMSALLVLIVVLAIHSLTLSGAKEGLSFYLLPDFNVLKENGINLVTQAMNQAFFTLSLGIASMEIFGSYMSKTFTLASEGLKICALDTFVAIMSGIIIFPACFSFGVNPGSGPNLLFVTLPNVFNAMSGGRIWGTLFFLFMLFAAMSTVIAVFENITSCICDLTGWERKKVIRYNIVGIILLSMPCVLGFNVWSHIQPMGKGSCVLDLEDFIVSNNLLPLGSLVYLTFCTSRYGWGWDNFIHEADTGEGVAFPKWIRFYATYILPLIVLYIFVNGYLAIFCKG